ncbi:hypothetical protein E1285_44740, partial [Actinomadura sp. 7K507]
MNRRGNGLSADTYAPLVDLAPHLADAMLAALGEAGVAAYAASPSDLPDLPDFADPVRDPVAGDVLDRLYVDVDMKPTAEGILRAHLARLRDTSARGPDSDRTETDLADPRDSADPLDTADPLGPADPISMAKAPDTARGDFPAKDADTPAERDEEAIWAEIVAGFDSVPEGDEVPWPEEENIREPEDPPQEGDDRTGRLPRARVIES